MELGMALPRTQETKFPDKSVKPVSDFMISIVIPVFNESKQIENTLGVLQSLLERSSFQYEIILVDDGSIDNTWEVISGVALRDSRIRALRLSRNFGKEAALCAGLDVTEGDACIVMDGDLQHPPALIPEMVRLWREEGYPVVEAVKKSRGRESFFNRLSASAFYKLMQRLSGLELNQASDFKLLDARIVAAWRLLRERQTFFRGLSSWLGFPRTQVFFDVADRQHGTSSWSTLHLFRLAITAITSFSSLPLQIVTVLGGVFMAGAIPLGIQTLYNWFSGIAVSGFTTVILLLLIVGSVLMFSLGVIGTYIANIFEEVKHRPRYLIQSDSRAGDQSLKKPIARE
jgi:glycosyltransferase involved in cell wall biosynthesis